MRKLKRDSHFAVTGAREKTHSDESARREAWPGCQQVRRQRLLRDVYAQANNPKLGKRWAFDALIVDEAHHALTGTNACSRGASSRSRAFNVTGGPTCQVGQDDDVRTSACQIGNQAWQTV